MSVKEEEEAYEIVFLIFSGRLLRGFCRVAKQAIKQSNSDIDADGPKR